MAEVCGSAERVQLQQNTEPIETSRSTADTRPDGCSTQDCRKLPGLQHYKLHSRQRTTIAPVSGLDDTLLQSGGSQHKIGWMVAHQVRRCSIFLAEHPPMRQRHWRCTVAERLAMPLTQEPAAITGHCCWQATLAGTRTARRCWTIAELVFGSCGLRPIGGSQMVGTA